MLVYIHQKNIAQAFILERYFFQLSGSKTREDSLFRMEDSPLRLADSPFRLADSSFRLEDRLADNHFSAISSSLYDVDNECRTAILKDMADFFTYLIPCRYYLLFPEYRLE